MTTAEFDHELHCNRYPDCRSLVMDKTISVVNWLDEYVISPSKFPSCMYSIGSWLEGHLLTIWCWLYEGSADEIRDSIEWALDPGMVPFQYRSARQREIARRLDEWIDNEEAPHA